MPTDGRIIGTAQLRALLSAAGGRASASPPTRCASVPALPRRPDAADDPPPRPGRRGLTVAPGSVLTFELEDSSGIDLTRLDDAHSIFVIVDDRGTPIDLTASFRYEPSSTTRGTATLTLPPLAGGAHMLEVHASDTFRNVGTATS